MDFKKASIDEINKAGASVNSETIGNYNGSCNEETAIPCGWRMVAYLRKEGIDRIARQLNIDIRMFTEEDYQKIATLFFSRCMASEKLAMATDYSLVAAIRLHMMEKESSEMERRRY